MLERKVDKIKRLEHELGRCRKKVGDDAKEIERLRKLLDQANEGIRETQTIVDAVLTAVALRYGEDAVDPDDEGKVLGKRLTIPSFDLPDVRRRYEIHARKDMEADAYIIGVVERDGRPG